MTDPKPFHYGAYFPTIRAAAATPRVPLRARSPLPSTHWPPSSPGGWIVIACAGAGRTWGALASLALSAGIGFSAVAGEVPPWSVATDPAGDILVAGSEGTVAESTNAWLRKIRR